MHLWVLLPQSWLFQTILTLLMLFGASLRSECFMSPQRLSQRGTKHCLRDGRDSPDPAVPEQVTGAVQCHQTSFAPLISSLQGLLWEPLKFPLFSCSVFAVKAVVNFCPALDSFLYGYLFLHSHVFLKPLRLSIFISQGFFKHITSFDVQENMKVQVHLLPSVAQYGKQQKT